jgi:hydroxymethylbilane synthase
MPPAAGQGALAVTARADDAATLALLAPFEDIAARREVTAERAFLAALDGSCRTPIAARAQARDGTLTLLGEVLTPDGARRWRRTGEAPNHDMTGAATLGAALGAAIRAEAEPYLVRD